MLQIGKTERIVRLGTAPVLSANGRYVAFEYGFSGLVPNDPDEGGGVFGLDLATGKIKRVSASLKGDKKNNIDLLLRGFA